LTNYFLLKQITGILTLFMTLKFYQRGDTKLGSITAIRSPMNNNK